MKFNIIFCARYRGTIHLVAFFVAGAIFGEVLGPFFVANAVPVSLFVAGRPLDEVPVFQIFGKDLKMSESLFY